MNLLHWQAALGGAGLWLMSVCAQAQDAAPQSGSDAQAEAAQPDTATSSEAPKLDTITVIGERRGQASSATRTPVPLLDTPVSLQVVSRETLIDQANVRLSDVYRNVSGVAPAYSGNNVSATETPIIRGFNVGNTFWNGFRLRGQGPSVLASVEQIEVLKGPGSVLYGRQEPGGLVNLITKQPQAEARYAVEQRIGSDAYYETLFDLGAPLGSDGKVRYRLNASYQNAESFRDFVDNERFYVAPVLAWTISPQTEFTLEGSYLHNDLLWDNGVVFSPATFDAPFSPVLPVERFLQEPGYRSTREETFASYRLTHSISERWQVRHLFLHHRHEFDINAYRVGTPTTPAPGELMVGRRFDGTVPTASEFNAILDTTYHFDFGSAKHTLLAGVDYGYEPGSGNKQNGLRGLPNPQPIDAFDPEYGAVPETFTETSFVSRRSLVGVYVQDQIALRDERLHLLLGLRYDYVDQESLFINPPGAPSGGARHDDAITWRAGALYRATSWLHPYVSYSEGFVPPSDSTVGEVDPETSHQYEAGFKLPFFDERLVANLSVYELTKDDILGDSNNDGISENFGELRSRGVEFDAVGQLGAGSSVIFTYAYTDTEVIRSTALPVGARFIAVPYQLGSLWLKHEFAAGSRLSGLALGGGVQYVGERAGNNANAFFVDDYTRCDAFARYRWPLQRGGAVTAQLNVQNLFDETYYEAVSNLTAMPGAPTQVLGMLRLDF